MKRLKDNVNHCPLCYFILIFIVAENKFFSYSFLLSCVVIKLAFCMQYVTPLESDKVLTPHCKRSLHESKYIMQISFSLGEYIVYHGVP